MSRYAAMFDRLSEAGEGAFGAFLMLGDPDRSTSATMIDAAVAGGADMLEVGIPFSDPVADGPVIQAAAVRALGAGYRVDHAFDQIAQCRAGDADIPIGILTYANLLAARGIVRFIADAAAAGADSLLIADVPTIEAEPYHRAALDHGIDLVMIAAPETPRPALQEVARLCTGYTYCVARSGVTGERATLALSHGRLFDDLRTFGAPPPVLGFGISTPDHVRASLSAGAAGVISGSAIVRIAQDQGADGVREFVATMKAATRPA